MDPLAHTLVGATLAETGLKRRTPLATATLLLGANAPDIDALTMLAGRDTALWLRRGWTHGVLATVILPFVVVGLVLAWDRWVRRRRHPDAPPARPKVILGLSVLSVLTHPALDWLNTYGVRLLMPFDDRWFYGDALFIVDPWFWLMMAFAVVLARSGSRGARGAWTLLGVAATALVLLADMVPVPARLAWCVGVAALVGVRFRGVGARRIPTLANGWLAALLLYVGGMLVGTAAARDRAVDHVSARGEEVIDVMAGPVPANPMVREVVVVTRARYVVGTVDWLADDPLRLDGPSLPREDPGPIVREALASTEVRGMRNWMRFPYYEVLPREDGGWEVVIRDLRYARPERERGFGVARVVVPREAAEAP
ncbi:MAG: metal-dependent hydrolase [Myxococcota bacterium]